MWLALLTGFGVLQQKELLLLQFYSASAETKPALILLSTTFWGEYCLLRIKSSCWRQWSTHHFVLFLEHRLEQGKPQNTYAHTYFVACLTLQISITFLKFIQKWPSLEIPSEDGELLGQTVHRQNRAYFKPTETSASAVSALFLPHTLQCTRGLGCFPVFWRIPYVTGLSVALLKLLSNCWASTKGKEQASIALQYVYFKMLSSLLLCD